MFNKVIFLVVACVLMTGSLSRCGGEDRVIIPSISFVGSEVEPQRSSFQSVRYLYDICGDAPPQKLYQGLKSLISEHRKAIKAGQQSLAIQATIMFNIAAANLGEEQKEYPNNIEKEKTFEMKKSEMVTAYTKGVEDFENTYSKYIKPSIQGKYSNEEMFARLAYYTNSDILELKTYKKLRD